jgi:hypothetical protein
MASMVWANGGILIILQVDHLSQKETKRSSISSKVVEEQ